MIEKRIDGNLKAPWLRCRGCHKTYWAENWHCQKCHENFDSKVDWHTSDKGCVPAIRMGWSVVDNVWTPN